MDKAPTYKNRLETLKQSVKSFQDALNINLSGKDPIEVDAIKSGQAQKFELTVELLWKAVKVFLFEIHGIECNSPKSCMKFLFQNSGLSENDYQSLIEMINQRNELSHIYNEKAFEKIWESLPVNLKIIKKCVRVIEGGI